MSRSEQGRHRNGDPTNNHIANLRWGTQEDNWKDRIRHGTGRSWSKLTAHDVQIGAGPPQERRPYEQSHRQSALGDARGQLEGPHSAWHRALLVKADGARCPDRSGAATGTATLRTITSPICVGGRKRTTGRTAFGMAPGAPGQS